MRESCKEQKYHTRYCSIRKGVSSDLRFLYTMHCTHLHKPYYGMMMCDRACMSYPSVYLTVYKLSFHLTVRKSHLMLCSNLCCRSFSRALAKDTYPRYFSTLYTRKSRKWDNSRNGEETTTSCTTACAFQDMQSGCSYNFQKPLPAVGICMLLNPWFCWSKSH